MKNIFKIFSCSLLLSLVACSTTEIAYNSKIDIRPAPQTDQYYLNWLLTKGAGYDDSTIYAAPKMLITKNKQEIIEFGELIKFRCEVFITEINGLTVAKTEVTIHNTEDDIIWSYTGETIIGPKGAEKKSVIKNSGS